MPGPQRREWGFLVSSEGQDRWIHNNIYLEQKAQQ